MLALEYYIYMNLERLYKPGHDSYTFTDCNVVITDSDFMLLNLPKVGWMDMSLTDPHIPRDSNLNKQTMLLSSWHGRV